MREPDGVVYVDGPQQRSDAVDELLELLRRPAWHANAACRAMGPDVFFVEKGPGVVTSDEVAKARAVCSGCPVIVECGEAGQRERFGTWGGMTTVERQKAKRARKDAAA